MHCLVFLSLYDSALIHSDDGIAKEIHVLFGMTGDEYGFTNAYYFLGEMEYEYSHGECPINVIWNMKYDIPGNILELTMAV